MYSVRNTPDPLKLQVRNVPCLCPPCIQNNGENCLNSQHADAWREVVLQPKSKSAFTKKKHPNAERHSSSPVVSINEEVEEFNNDEDVHMVISSDDDSSSDIYCEDTIDLTTVAGTRDNEGNGELYIALTAQPNTDVPPWSDDEDGNSPINIDPDFPEEEDNHSDRMFPHEYASSNNEEEGIKIDAELPRFDGLSEEEIPEDIFWESVLSSMESCISYSSLQCMAEKMKDKLPPICLRKAVPFKIESEFIDATATETLPIDAPQDVYAIATIGDGNCFCRALSRAYCGDDSMYMELRARIVIEGIVNRDMYLSNDIMERGATIAREEESIPETYAKFTDNYISGQRLSKIMIEFLYAQELYECSRQNSYMGLWQIAQAASVVNMPIISVYPEGGDDMFRLDFHRKFYPVQTLKKVPKAECLMIMWTAIELGHVPNHFVPLLPKLCNKYAENYISY